VHLDGYNQLPYLTGEAKESARKEFFYFNDDGNLVALRYDRWKMHFTVQENHGFGVWQRGWTPLRVPMLVDLRADPFERAQHDSEDFNYWMVERIYLLAPVLAFVGQFLASFKEFPPRQKMGSFTIDQVLEKLQAGSGKD
jgi:hypothetical protein